MIDHLGFYIFVAIVNCMTPGAGVLYTLSNAFRYGKKSWYVSPFGIATGVFFMAFIAACGLGALIRANELIFSLMQILGCLVMIWLGYRNWVAPCVNFSDAVAVASRYSPKQNRSIFFSALLLQTTNPMLIVFVLSLLPQFVSPERSYEIQMGILIAMLVFICWIVHLVYSYLAVSACRFLKGTRFSFWLNHISALLFWLMSVIVLINVYQHLVAKNIL